MAKTSKLATQSLPETMMGNTSVGEAHQHLKNQALPHSIGRYLVKKILGEGGYGCVYLAFDDELQRHVTVKVPHQYRITTPQDVQNFLAEASMLAKLEHPNVVAVHDVGHTPNGICYIVSRFIDGSDLHAPASMQRRRQTLRATRLLGRYVCERGFADTCGWLIQTQQKRNGTEGKEKPSVPRGIAVSGSCFLSYRRKGFSYEGCCTESSRS